MEQVIIAIVIIVLGVFVFHFYPFERGNIMKLVMSAIFVILTAICKRLSIMIPLFGTESLKIGFEYIPLMLAGYFLSPSYCFLIGLSSDLIGLIITPTGFPFFGFTLGTILVCVIPSLVKQNTKVLSPKTIQNMVTILIILLGILGSVYIWFLDELTISSTVYTLNLTYKCGIIALCILLCVIFITIIYFIKKRINEKESKTFSIWILSVVLVEMICTLCLTPLWLQIMYGIPFLISFCIRVIKECAVLPIEIFLGYSLIKILEKVFKHQLS